MEVDIQEKINEFTRGIGKIVYQTNTQEVKDNAAKQEAAQALLDSGFNWDKPEVLALLQGVAGKVAKPKVERTVKVKAKKVTVKAPVADVKMTPREAEKVRAEFMKKLKAAYEAA